jgi:phosphatidylethanolamine/phosphatidyl-N-methylethanolamine N-methyltransferase
MKGNMIPGIEGVARKGLSRPRRRMEPLRPEQEVVLFLTRWLKAPARIGALAPSSQHLARAMARQIDLQGEGFVIELGGGTGSITRALLEAGLAPERLIVVERDATLAALLRRRFPGVKILRGDASALVKLLEPLGITSVAEVVSSLPLLSMPKSLRRLIVEESFALLGENGTFVQFTYGVASPLAGREFDVVGHVAQRVWLNFPPAAVWLFRRPAQWIAAVA